MNSSSCYSERECCGERLLALHPYKVLISYFQFSIWCYFPFKELVHFAEYPIKIGHIPFQSYHLLKGFQNNRKQKHLFPLFGSISKSIFANFDSFCLIIPHICMICRRQLQNKESIIPCDQSILPLFGFSKALS